MTACNGGDKGGGRRRGVGDVRKRERRGVVVTCEVDGWGRRAWRRSRRRIGMEVGECGCPCVCVQRGEGGDGEYWEGEARLGFCLVSSIFFLRLASRLPIGERLASFQRRHAFARSCSPAARQLASRLARI